MSVLEIVRSMSEEQARRILPIVRATKAGDIAGAKKMIDGLTVEELDKLIAYLEAIQAKLVGPNRTHQSK